MKDILVNVGHTSLAKVVMMGVQLTTATILSRSLSAEDYGIVGFANLLIAFLARIQGMGLMQAVVRLPDLDQRTIETAASLNVLLSFLAFLMAQILSPIAGWLLKAESSVLVMRVVAVSFLLAPLGFIPATLLNRELRFGALRTPSIIGSVVRGFVAVGMAISGWKYWSIVFGNMIETLVTNGLLQSIRHIPFRWRMDIDVARHLLGFGMPIAGLGLLTFAIFNADNFIIGSVLGSAMLGYYSVAFNWATIGSVAIQEVVHSVLFVKFSHFQNDIKKMRDAYIRTLRIVAFGAAIVNMGLFVVADSFLFDVLGKGTFRWWPALTSLKVLCVFGTIRAVVETVGNPIMAMGDSRLLLKANTCAAIVEILLLPFVVKIYGIVGVSILVTAAYSTQCFFYLPFIKRILGVSIKALALIATRVALSAAGGWGAALIPSINPLSWIGGLVRLTIFILVFILIHEILSRGSMCSELHKAWQTFTGM